jgi:hypothetical protein
MYYFLAAKKRMPSSKKPTVAKKKAAAATSKGKDPLPYFANLQSKKDVNKALQIAVQQQAARALKAKKAKERGKEIKKKQWSAGTLLSFPKDKKKGGGAGKFKKGGGKKKPNVGSNPEERLQHAAVVYLKSKYPHVYFCGSLAGLGIAAATQRARRIGYRVGAPDMPIEYPKGLFTGCDIEFKIAPNKPTEKQLQVHDQLRAAGRFVKVIYSIEEFVATIDWYMNLPESPMLRARRDKQYKAKLASIDTSVSDEQKFAKALLTKLEEAKRMKDSAAATAAVIDLDEWEDDEEQYADQVELYDVDGDGSSDEYESDD